MLGPGLHRQGLSPVEQATSAGIANASTEWHDNLMLRNHKSMLTVGITKERKRVARETLELIR